MMKISRANSLSFPVYNEMPPHRRQPQPQPVPRPRPPQQQRVVRFSQEQPYRETITAWSHQDVVRFY